MANNINLYFLSSMAYRLKKLVAWQKPPRDWWKVNIDGIYRAATNLACCSGLIRDKDGVCLRSICSSSQALGCFRWPSTHLACWVL